MIGTHLGSGSRNRLVGLSWLKLGGDEHSAFAAFTATHRARIRWKLPGEFLQILRSG